MSEGPSPAQQQLIDLASKVQEQLQALWGKAKEVEAIKNALEQVEELLAGPKAQFNDAMEQLRETLDKIINSSIGQTLGLSKSEVAAVEDAPQDDE